MNNKRKHFCLLALLFFFIACNNSSDEKKPSTASSITAKGDYAYDAEFLKKYTRRVIELENEEGNAKILLSADYQGRVMTSTARGDSGTSYGWINYDLIASGKKRKQFNPVGGEERFWMGPEGGQYSIYFKAGDSFNINHWQVPAIIDTITYDVTQSDERQVLFSKNASLTNYSGTTFDITIERRISLLNKNEIGSKLKLSIPDNIHFVGYKTENQITNSGNNNWIKEKGLLSVW
jgi:hypothetical protein